MVVGGIEHLAPAGVGFIPLDLARSERIYPLWRVPRTGAGRKVRQAKQVVSLANLFRA
jgi:hypothetical protein